MTDIVAVGSTGWVEVRVDSKQTDGWCFCTPRSHPKDLEMGRVKGEFNDRYQFFGNVVPTPTPVTAPKKLPGEQLRPVDRPMPVTREAIDGMFKTLNAADRAIVSETSDNYYGADVADLIGDRLSITTTELRDALAYALIRGGLRPHLPPPDRDPGC